jgi:hypothetical protein
LSSETEFSGTFRLATEVAELYGALKCFALCRSGLLLLLFCLCGLIDRFQNRPPYPHQGVTCARVRRVSKFRKQPPSSAFTKFNTVEVSVSSTLWQCSRSQAHPCRLSMSMCTVSRPTWASRANSLMSAIQVGAFSLFFRVYLPFHMCRTI